MTKAEKARIVTEILNMEYPDRKPLLNYSNPFELLIAVILSAQTTDAGVNKVTPELFRRYPGPAELALAEQNHVEEIIHSTGFYRMKAANIIKTAAALQERGDNSLPDNMKELTALPGVGRKTANVILYHIFNKPAIIVDTHFKRVTKRLGFTRYTEPEKIEKQLLKAIPEDIQSDFSMTINLHGRKYCFARKPDCEHCPLRDLCPSASLPPG
ncbi:MAG: endonuclease III [Spirochaetales bacterium]|nr:endonuclease III [Spirochaetales bacterium]